ncbi:MAG: ABC transporter permease subunit [Clostridiales bacterium]|nr:ABC transporter permease subunit [Clostridiales bacterium]MBQ3107024.1 ABC transporter permease subunit [Bacillota bacterium]
MHNRTERPVLAGKTTEKAALWERILAVLAALLLWQIAAWAVGNKLLLVSPVVVVERLFALVLTGDFWLTAAYSFLRIAEGFLLGVVTGAVLAVLAARFRLAEVLVWPYMAAVKAVPVASFIILCLIWLDSRQLSVFISFLMVLPIIYTNLLQGIKSTDSKLLEMASLFRMNWTKRVRYIYLPQMEPYILSACRVSIGLGWKAGIAAEVIGIPEGTIGEKLYMAKVHFESGDLFAWTVVIVVVSILFEKGFVKLLARLLQRREGK